MANKGSAFEEYLQVLHKTYENRGLARVRKTTPPMSVLLKPVPSHLTGGIVKSIQRLYKRMKVSPGRLFVGIFLSDGEPDFKGVLKGGQMVSFDAKCTTRDRFYFKSLIKDHQIKSLAGNVQLGALGFFLIRHGARDYLLPVNAKGQHPLQGPKKASCKWEEVEQWKIPRSKTWLDVAMKYSRIWNEEGV